MAAEQHRRSRHFYERKQFTLEELPTLIRRVGYFRCSNCTESFRSTDVWCDASTLEIELAVRCPNCKREQCEASKIKDMKCKICNMSCVKCSCTEEEKILNGYVERQHLKSKCPRCFNQRYPCRDWDRHGNYRPEWMLK